jgi:hypothetical protein
LDEKHARPMPPTKLQQPVKDLPPMGEAFKAYAEDMLAETVARTTGSGFQR